MYIFQRINLTIISRWRIRLETSSSPFFESIISQINGFKLNSKDIATQKHMILPGIKTIIEHVQPINILRGLIKANNRKIKTSLDLVSRLMPQLEMEIKLILWKHLPMTKDQVSSIWPKIKLRNTNKFWVTAVQMHYHILQYNQWFYRFSIEGVNKNRKASATCELYMLLKSNKRTNSYF